MKVSAPVALQMRSRFSVVRRVLSAVALFVLVATATQASAEVGGEPTHDYIECIRPERPCSPSIVLWERRQFNGPVEYVGFTSKGELLCSGLDYVKDPKAGSGFGCDSVDVPPDRLTGFVSWGFLDSKKGSVSDASGILSPDVARLQLHFRTRGKRRSVAADVVTIDGRLQKRLELDQPVKFFVASVRGSVKRWRATARNASGARIGTFRIG